MQVTTRTDQLKHYKTKFISLSVPWMDTCPYLEIPGSDFSHVQDLEAYKA